MVWDKWVLSRDMWKVRDVWIPHKFKNGWLLLLGCFAPLVSLQSRNRINCYPLCRYLLHYTTCPWQLVILVAIVVVWKKTDEKKNPKYETNNYCHRRTCPHSSWRRRCQYWTAKETFICTTTGFSFAACHDIGLCTLELLSTPSRSCHIQNTGPWLRLLSIHFDYDGNYS